MTTPRQPKRPRTERRDDCTLVLTTRDTDILLLVGLVGRGLISAEQIGRELFPSEDRSRRRLRQLFDAGYLSLSLVTPTRPNLVSLTRRGLEYVRSQAPELANQIHTAGPLKMSELDHRLLVVDARLYASALGSKRGSPLLTWASGVGLLSMRLGLDAYNVDPDAIAEFSCESGSVAVAVEAVSNIKPVSALARRLPRYGAVARDGRVDALWVAVPDAKTATAVQGILSEHALDGWMRVLDREHLIARPVRELAERGGTDGPYGSDRRAHTDQISSGTATESATAPRR